MTSAHRKFICDGSERWMPSRIKPCQSRLNRTDQIFEIATGFISGVRSAHALLYIVDYATLYSTREEKCSSSSSLPAMWNKRQLSRSARGEWDSEAARGARRQRAAGRTTKGPSAQGNRGAARVSKLSSPLRGGSQQAAGALWARGHNLWCSRSKSNKNYVI